MKAQLIVDDFGFLFNKALIGDRKIMMKSIVGNSIKLQFRDLNLNKDSTKDDIIAQVDGVNYFLSDLAIAQSKSVVHSLKPDRFDSNALKVLLSATLGMGLGSGNHVAYFVSGLPISHYSEYKNDIKSLFLDTEHKFDVTLNGVTNFKGTVTPVKAKFIPQPFGAGLDRILGEDGEVEDKELASKTVAVIDPGFGTTDVYVMNSLSPVEKLTFSTNTAMNHAYSLIASKIQEFGVSMPLYKIEEVFTTKRFKHKGVSYDMEPTVNWAIGMSAQQLSAEITNTWGSELNDIDEILIAGGGGIALYPYLKKEFESVNLIPDSQWAVARGYRKWGMRHWKNLLV